MSQELNLPRLLALDHQLSWMRECFCQGLVTFCVVYSFVWRPRIFAVFPLFAAVRKPGLSFLAWLECFLSCRYPNAVKLLRSYGRFLEQVKNDPWAAARYFA